jgi:hypothetical protein
MTAINIGPGAIERASGGAPNYTQVSKTNPANETGVIDTVEILAGTDMTGVVVASFYVVSGNNLSTRDSVNIGNVPAGSKQTFTGLSLQVQAGDFIGLYCATGTLKVGSPAGSGRWYKSGNYIPCINTAFTSSSISDYSLGGSGSTPGGYFILRAIGAGVGVGIG